MRNWTKWVVFSPEEREVEGENKRILRDTYEFWNKRDAVKHYEKLEKKYGIAEMREYQISPQKVFSAGGS